MSSTWLNVKFLFKEAVLIAFLVEVIDRSTWLFTHVTSCCRTSQLRLVYLTVYVSVLHSVCGGHAVHVLRLYTRWSRERMPVLRPLPLPHPTALIVSTPVSSNLPLSMLAPFGRNLLYWLTFSRAMTWMYLLWLSLGTRKTLWWWRWQHFCQETVVRHLPDYFWGDWSFYVVL